MRRATVTIPDELAEAVDSYARAQDARPAFTTIVQSALRHYLAERGFLRETRPLVITPAKKGSGLRDVSEAHDRYLTQK